MNYDGELHSAWVQQALQLAMDYREAEPGREVRDAMRAMKAHFEGRPASMDAADRERSELRARAERAEADAALWEERAQHLGWRRSEGA